MKEHILMEIATIEREGKQALIDWLENQSDFFTAPASTSFHLSEEGGLAKHSYNVFRALFDLNKNFNLELNTDSITICGLLHDVCKANTYVIEQRNVKENGVWVQKPFYKYNPKYPAGHGEKSVFIINQFIKLRYDEMLAIRWHMGAWDLSDYSGKMDIGRASENKLVSALHIADMIASKLIETKGE